MEDLIKALQIFLKYGNKKYPTSCEHDILYVGIDPSIVSDEDKKTLDELGFFVDDENDCFASFKYGSM
jgi:DNA-binding protein YbaB